MPQRKYPEEVSVLTYRDMACDTYEGRNGRGCLLTWFNRDFGLPLRLTVHLQYEFPFAYSTLERIVDLRGRSISEVNDEMCLNHHERAHLWNRWMYLLGYTENNPQGAKPHRLETKEED